MKSPLLLIPALLILPALAEEQATFENPVPGTWQIHDPRVLGGLSPSTVQFTSGQCHLAAPPPTTMEEYLAAGTARVGVFAPEQFTDCVASLDNFLAWDGTPPTLTILPGVSPNTVILTSDFQRSLGTDLETTTDPSSPTDPWQTITPASASHTNGQWSATFPIDAPPPLLRPQGAVGENH